MQKQILIVEDNELNRAIICEILSGQYRVLEAENGQEGLDILQQNKEVALILLDMMMPVMDGYTFLDRLREDEELSLIPVIVLTQSNSESDEVAALAHGATDFVPKPYRPKVILHRVASLIKLRENAAMINQFQYDRLTGMYSQEFFYQKVRERLQEDPEHEYSIVCSNVENFKLYNDTFGRDMGDRLLQATAAVSQQMVGEDGICGRLSADRFLFLQTREQEKQDRANFGKDFNLLEDELTTAFKGITIRWGVYEIVDRSVSVEQMCDRALLAMESIKGRYNEFFAVYDDALRSKLLREKAITDAMEPALAEEQFIVFYQPKYSLKDNCLAGAEALVRWNHPEWGFMSPGEFIPLFERNGFILRLDEYVWEKVCAQLQSWKQQGYPLLPVSVNVSRADAFQVSLADELENLTKRYNVDPACLHLEITESCYAENPAQIIDTVDELRKRGFVVEMDDFGSGYSSLNMLSQLKLDTLKLDMKFIQSEMEKSIDRSILYDVISMAHRMHLNVVAEGVETREQMNRLLTVGCDYVQGFFLAKPMPAAEYEKLMKTQQAILQSAHRFNSNEIPRSILVADENAAFRALVRKSFEPGFRVLEAGDANGALDCVAKASELALCAMILSMSLPENGAATVMNTLRQNSNSWAIPVLATIADGSHQEDLALAEEADDFLCRLHPVSDLRKRVERMIDHVTFLERENALQAEANKDFLTGLLNRRGLQSAVMALRKDALPLAVYLFDLDNLKTINDTRGHDVGDRLIRTFAELLRGQTQEQDVLCRYGGDEFVAIIRNLGDEAAAQKKCEEICRAFSKCFAEEEMGIPVTCTGGIALCGKDEVPSMELVERADRAMYRAKRERKKECNTVLH